MRFARFACLGVLSLGILGLALTTSAAYADGARNFGSTTCREVFNCSDTSIITTQATSCATSGLGRSADFSGSSPDSDGCMSSSGDGKSGSSIVCCAKPAAGQDGMCRMSCSLMVGTPSP